MSLGVTVAPANISGKVGTMPSSSPPPGMGFSVASIGKVQGRGTPMIRCHNGVPSELWIQACAFCKCLFPYFLILVSAIVPRLLLSTFLQKLCCLAGNHFWYILHLALRPLCLNVASSFFLFERLKFLIGFPLLLCFLIEWYSRLAPYWLPSWIKVYPSLTAFYFCVES